MKKIYALLAGLFVVYMFTFVYPVFFNYTQKMIVYDPVPRMSRIGVDLNTPLTARLTSYENGTLYSDSLYAYPPFASVLYCPLVVFDFFTAYKILSIVTILLFFSAVFVIPLIMCKNVDTSCISVLLVAGLISYGFQFEIERGQTNVIAICLASWSLVIFHRCKFRWNKYVAIILLSFAIQLKLYPAIFLFLMIDTKAKPIENVRIFALVLLVNFSMLFCFGVDTFVDFFNKLFYKHTISAYVWPGNCSFYSYLKWASGTIFLHHFDIFLLTSLFLSITGASLVFILSAKYNKRFVVKYLVVIFSCLCLLIPSMSHDYKLPILVIAFSFFLSEMEEVRNVTMFVLLFFTISLFSYTLFPGILKLTTFENNAIAIIPMMFVLSLLMAKECYDEKRRCSSRDAATLKVGRRQK